jgi:hypothetical protein
VLDAELDVLVGLLAGLGDVHEPHEPPGLAVDRHPEGGRPFLDHPPVEGQGVEAGRLGGADGQEADPVPAGQLGPGR